VLWAVNLGCLGFHVWPSQASDPEHAEALLNAISARDPTLPDDGARRQTTVA